MSRTQRAPFDVIVHRVRPEERYELALGGASAVAVLDGGSADVFLDVYDRTGERAAIPAAYSGIIPTGGRSLYVDARGVSSNAQTRILRLLVYHGATLAFTGAGNEHDHVVGTIIAEGASITLSAGASLNLLNADQLALPAAWEPGEQRRIGTRYITGLVHATSGFTLVAQAENPGGGWIEYAKRASVANGHGSGGQYVNLEGMTYANGAAGVDLARPLSVPVGMRIRIACQMGGGAGGDVSYRIGAVSSV